ncbi:MAG: elongator complex protein 3 [Candidatus Methanomethylophilaceae archaeon]|nr:elongator complex protein 3 [Candidatus Methanomethylophilaceae archaeon]MDI3541230.1 elongator complex protein 3 [Candidatus Methanomethylophilaceae archaeon]
MTAEEDFLRRIVADIDAGRVGGREELQNAKLKLCRELGLSRVPSNSEILGQLDASQRKRLRPLLMNKPVRTLSGVVAVAAMTSPYPCPHGRCAFCPGGVEGGSPQSYTGKEPAARRGARNDFDPYRQVSDRLRQLRSIGHDTDKVDLIIMGGTFTSRDPVYQEDFVKGCFDAMNGLPSHSLEEAHFLNEFAPHRCVGMTLETRPDAFGDEQLARALRLGTTRVEFGVQILDDEVLMAMNRGHGVDAVRDASCRAKEAGLKVCYHLMPGLPGSGMDKDLASMRRIFDDSDFRPDMLKIYPTLVIKGTPLYKMWEEGTYRPYSLEEGVELVAEMKAMVPEYVRIQRIQRDIPAPEIEAGIYKGDLRMLARQRLEETGRSCRCIRCREVGQLGRTLDPEKNIVQKETVYEASRGWEHFITLEQDDAIIGYVRMRINSDDQAAVRELKVFGRASPLGEEGEWQHRGFGQRLLHVAETTAVEEGASSVRVTSGVGVRPYYASLGYERRGPYMEKQL